jgi:hypothetical protein
MTRTSAFMLPASEKIYKALPRRIKFMAVLECIERTKRNLGDVKTHGKATNGFIHEEMRQFCERMRRAHLPLKTSESGLSKPRGRCVLLRMPAPGKRGGKTEKVVNQETRNNLDSNVRCGHQGTIRCVRDQRREAGGARHLALS